MKRQADETWHPMDLRRLQLEHPHDAERLRAHVQGLLLRGTDPEAIMEEFHIHSDTLCQTLKRLRLRGRRPRAAPLFCRAGCGWPAWERGFCRLHMPKREERRGGRKD